MFLKLRNELLKKTPPGRYEVNKNTAPFEGNDVFVLFDLTLTLQSWGFVIKYGIIKNIISIIKIYG